MNIQIMNNLRAGLNSHKVTILFYLTLLIVDLPKHHEVTGFVLRLLLPADNRSATVMTAKNI
jgi:hypothetical protein